MDRTVSKVLLRLSLGATILLSCAAPRDQPTTPPGMAPTNAGSAPNGGDGSSPQGVGPGNGSTAADPTDEATGPISTPATSSISATRRAVIGVRG